MTKHYLALLIFVFCFISIFSTAQTPQKFNYQAAVRNNAGLVLSNQNVSIRANILADSPTGSIIYSERHAVTTNAYGLVNLQIGGGTILNGSFSTINWQTGTKFIEIACDANGGTNYIVLGATQLLSVPYALYAETSGASGIIGPTGATGPTGISCLSLNDAYNGCSGNGSGNQITVTHNKIDLNLPTTSASDQAMYLSILKGSNAAPASGISISHQQHGHALFAEMTNTSNMHSALKGILKSNNTNTSAFPSAVSGVFDGSGCGVGIWGEITASATTGSGAGLYGMASNNNFGAILSSANYPGLNCKTANASSQAAQIVSANASFTNPSLQVRGWSQFDCSPATASSVIINNLASEPTIAASAAQYGYIGTNSYPWYYLYYMNAIQVSAKETKRDILYLDNPLFEWVMNDLDKIKPSFYKYNIETDDFQPENPSKYRPQYHLGLILDDTPDYLQDNTFSGIDLYALSTMTLTGVKHNRARIKNIEQQLEQQSITDFGKIKMQSGKVVVKYAPDFISKLSEHTIPVVSITPNMPNVNYYISSQSAEGFVLEIEGGGGAAFEFNWVAYAKAKVSDDINAAKEISPDVLSKIKIQNKSDIKNRKNIQQTKVLELK